MDAPIAKASSVFRALLSQRGEPLAVWGWFGSVLGSGSFIHRSSRSYYLFFNYLSYYLYVRLQREWDIWGSKLRDSGNRC